MVNLSQKIDAEKENVERVLAELEKVMRKKEKSVVELAAIATFLHNIYNGIENILKQILKEKNVPVGKSELWHKELLEQSVKNRIISEKMADDLREYLAFRHFFIHGYGFMLEEAPLKKLADGIPGIWSRLLSEIEKFRKD